VRNSRRRTWGEGAGRDQTEEKTKGASSVGGKTMQARSPDCAALPACLPACLPVWAADRPTDGPSAVSQVVAKDQFIYFKVAVGETWSSGKRKG
jgi:hypothetical protein